jgi:hypothetical protein
LPVLVPALLLSRVRRPIIRGRADERNSRFETVRSG